MQDLYSGSTLVLSLVRSAHICVFGVITWVLMTVKIDYSQNGLVIMSSQRYAPAKMNNGIVSLNSKLWFKYTDGVWQLMHTTWLPLNSVSKFDIYRICFSESQVKIVCSVLDQHAGLCLGTQCWTTFVNSIKRHKYISFDPLLHTLLAKPMLCKYSLY